MKFYLISDNIDTHMGMRLAGINGVIVHEADEVKAELEKVLENREIAVVLITEKLVTLCHELIFEIKHKYKSPLIVEIPDRHGTSHIAENLNQYVSDAVGIRFE
ncbi:MAG: ATP synthase subunit F [Ruminococcus sp.]|nr:ATP synthase subunit F [Ruminococcus sp.]